MRISLYLVQGCGDCHGVNLKTATRTWRILPATDADGLFQMAHCWAGVRRLQSALTLAAEESTSAKGGPSSRHLKPIVHAVEMVFASAAALSAAFGRKVGQLLLQQSWTPQASMLMLCVCSLRLTASAASSSRAVQEACKTSMNDMPTAAQHVQSETAIDVCRMRWALT